MLFRSGIAPGLDDVGGALPHERCDRPLVAVLDRGEAGARAVGGGRAPDVRGHGCGRGCSVAVLRGEHPGELTTAAGVWVVASIGVATGLGYTSMAIAATMLGILVFSVLSRFESRIRMRFGEAYTGKE